MRVFGHRGAAGHCPENTLAGLRGTMGLGLLYDEDFDRALQLALRLSARSLHMALENLAAADVALAHQHDRAVYVYTVNDVAAIRRCRDVRLNGVFSDCPDRVLLTRHDG